MLAIVGAFLFLFIAILTVLVACGLPLGELTMGGQHKVLPRKMRVMACISILTQVFAIIIILQSGGYLPLWLSFHTTKFICGFFGAYLSLNTVMNLISRSRKERIVMTPLSLCAAICFWVTSLQM